MKKPKKYTHQQRMSRMEKVLTTYYVIIQSLQQRIKIIEDKLGIKNDKDDTTV
tara:strand:- start:600 stop:758 length:159 start_codon:yes stop_codon:yes gene_type:complete